MTIRAGDVGRLMSLQQKMPNVCSALGGRKFEALADVGLIDRAGPPVGANTVFTFAINGGPSTGLGDDASRKSTSQVMPSIPPKSTMAPRRELGMSPPRGSALQTAVVFPCAASKDPNAGHLRMPDGQPVFFVAEPAMVPAKPSILYRRPDDHIDDRHTFRDVVREYNLRPDENPWGLLPAWQLYSNPAYGELTHRLGIANLFILSAGWGLIKADFLTPNYDITFSASAERYKRRPKRDRYEDFQQLPVEDIDRVVFAGGKDYIPMFLSLTSDLDVDRVVFFNSVSALRAPNARFVRYETDTRTNWHYEWARSWLDGEIALE